MPHLFEHLMFNETKNLPAGRFDQILERDDAAIDALFVKPTTLTFTVEGETKTLGIAEIMEMREKDTQASQG